MVIWLRKSDNALQDANLPAADIRVGCASDIIPAEEFAQLVSIEDAFTMLARERESVIAAAREQAAQIVEQAHQQASSLIAQAQQEYAAASALGHKEGTTEALTHWHERIAEYSHSQGELLKRGRHRFAQMVSTAVEQIVRTESHEALFKRSLGAVERIANMASYLTISVHPDDLAQAQATFESWAQTLRELGRPLVLTVQMKAGLEPGSCVCESDLGSVDASLGTQLQAVHQAIARALARSIEDDAAARAMAFSPQRLEAELESELEEDCARLDEFSAHPEVGAGGVETAIIELEGEDEDEDDFHSGTEPKETNW